MRPSARSFSSVFFLLVLCSRMSLLWSKLSVVVMGSIKGGKRSPYFLADMFFAYLRIQWVQFWIAENDHTKCSCKVIYAYISPISQLVKGITSSANSSPVWARFWFRTTLGWDGLTTQRSRLGPRSEWSRAFPPGFEWSRKEHPIQIVFP
jgi:hypothetical protein